MNMYDTTIAIKNEDIKLKIETLKKFALTIKSPVYYQEIY